MYPISNTVKALYEAEQHQVLRITGTDKNGAAISITDADIVLNSFKLEIGTATAAEMTLKLDNRQGDYDNIVFEGTELYVEIGIADWTQDNPTIYWMPCGYFTPDEQPRTRDIITIHALDRMMRFDVVPPVMTPWVTQGGDYVTDSQGNIIYFLSNVQFPITVQNLVKRVAMLCGVPFVQNIGLLPNSNYVISSLPNLQQEITCRNLIQWCAGIMGANAWIDWYGNLRFSWYGESTDYTSTTANRFSSDLHEDDITVTGIQYTNVQGATIVSGSPDYALDMTGNYLAASGIAEILPNIKNRLNGFTYRPFSASVINAPYLWPMDMVTFTDKDGNDHVCALTNVNFGINGSMEVQGKGETAQTNSGVGPNGVTTEQARLIEQAYEVANNLDQSLDQEGIFNRLTNNGEAQGMYIIDGQVYVNMSYARSGTLILGGLNNRNGLLEVQDAAGNVIGSWDKSGVQILSGFLDMQNGQGHLSTKTQINKSFDKQFTTEYYSQYTGTTTTNIGFGVIESNNDQSGSSMSIRSQGISLLSTYNDEDADYPYIELINSSKNTNVNIDAYGISISKNNVVWFSLSYEDNSPYMTVHGDVEVYGNLYASGAKPRLVSTDDYSERFLYCYETPTPLFGDVGEGTIGEDGRCYIWLDPVFAQTITTADYQVFLQRYGKGDCWIAERKPNCFVVEGTPGLTFGWELKARQRDFDQFRLEKNDKYGRKEHNYGADAALYIDSLKKERVST